MEAEGNSRWHFEAGLYVISVERRFTPTSGLFTESD